MRIVGWVLTVLLGLSACCPPAAVARGGDKEDIAPEAATGFRKLSSVQGRRHMVVAANPHASRAGMEMLRAGGSAVDAAVAMAVMLTLVEPQSSGIGGGLFMLHFRADGAELSAYDGRETAPAAATANMFQSAEAKPLAFYDAVVGGLSVGVPGELRALELAHRRHGKLPWKRLFAPTIALARSGFAISPRLHSLVTADKHLSTMEATRGYFYRPDGTAKPVGTLLRNPQLAAVLQAVADGGADAFYQGAIAKRIVAAVAKARNPGRLSEADMAGYQAVARKPVCRGYRKQWRVCGMPPPTSGGITTLQIMGILSQFDLTSLKPSSSQAVHLFAEAGRLAYADRGRFVADPAFVQVPVDALLDEAYLRRRAKLVDPARTMGKASPGAVDSEPASSHWATDRSIELPSTSHLVVIDEAGNSVSMTASVENAFGSRLMVDGFLLNNQLTDFSFVAQKDGHPVANRVEPGKRPRSSMAPMLVLSADGKRFLMAVGSPGGSRIIAYVARTLVAVLDHQLDIQTAINLPNVANRNGATEIEQMPAMPGWAEQTGTELRERGHEVKIRDMNSGLHAIVRRGEVYFGGADPRREGVALGD